MAKVKKNKNKKGRKKKGGKNPMDMDFSAAENFIPPLNIDFNTGPKGVFDEKLASIGKLNEVSATQKKLDNLIKGRKGTNSYSNENILDIVRKTSRVFKGFIAESNEFLYDDGKTVKEGTPYHIHFTVDLKKYHMTQVSHNKVNSRLIYKIKEDEYSMYTRLSESKPLTIKSSVVIPEEKDYKRQFMIRTFAKKANQVDSSPFEIKKNQIDSSPLYNYVTFKFMIRGDRERVRRFNTKKIREASLTIPNLDKYINPFQFFREAGNKNIKDQILERLNLPPVDTAPLLTMDLGMTGTIGAGLSDMLKKNKGKKKKRKGGKKKY